MTVSLTVRVDEPRLEAVYSWLQQRRGSTVQLFGSEAGKKAALLAYGGEPMTSSDGRTG